MIQKDYLLKEIEKIGLIINAVRQKLLGGNDNLAINIEEHINETKTLLKNELDFDLEQFLLLNTEASNTYLSSITGFNIDNIELLAEYISQLGFIDNSIQSKKYLEKALQLYKYCNIKSKNYSFQREQNIQKIKNAL